MKHLISFFLFWVIAFTLNAQTQKSSVQHRTTASDLVVEGKVVECQSFWNEDYSQILTSNLIEVFKLFKGNLVGDKLEIITKGGVVDDRFSIVSHQTTFKVGMEGVFFCKTKGSLSNLGKSANKPSMMTSAETGFIQYYFERFNPPAADKSASYKNIKKEIWDEVVLSCREPVRRIKPNTLEAKVQNMFTILPEDEPDFFTGPGLSFTFENVSFSSDYQNITFDIFAKCSETGIKFGKTKVFVDYASEVFGENAAAAGNISVSRGDIIQNSAYSVSSSDASNETVLIDVTSSFASSIDAYTLTTIGEKFCHVELEIENLLALANIGFDQFKMTGNSWYYDPVTSSYLPFERVGISGPIKGAGDPNNFVLINYEFDNINITESGGDKFLEFDVDAYSNVSWTRLAQSQIFILYNPDAFGNTPHTDGNFSSTLNPILQGLGYISDSDQFPGSIRILTYQQSPDSLKYLQLPTTPTKIIHCKLKILDCAENAGISFAPELMNAFPQYYFGELPIPLIEYSFGEEGLGSSYDQFLCKENAPIITKIYPKDLRAGVNEVLTIKGQNLKMSSTDNGKFYFRSVKNPKSTIYSYAYDNDVITWTDTLIEIFVPSDLQEDRESAASGKVIVENALGLEAKSDETIDIQYSIVNFRPDEEAFRISYINADGLGGYIFSMDDELNDLNPDECIKRALKEWACKTKINWKLSTVPIFGLEKEDNDGNSTIILGDSLVVDSSAAIAYAVLSGHTKECDSGMSIAGFYVDDLDIVVNKYKNHQFNCDSIGSITEEDFYTTLVHELGHAHMLLHSVHDFNAIYTYSTVRSPSGDDVAGGLDAITWSNGWTEGGDCPSKHESKDCATPSIEVENLKATSFQVYPNPFQSGITLESTYQTSDEVQIYVTDIAGKVILFDFLETGKLKKEINLNNLSVGIYILNVRGDKESISLKLIKSN